MLKSWKGSRCLYLFYFYFYLKSDLNDQKKAERTRFCPVGLKEAEYWSLINVHTFNSEVSVAVETVQREPSAARRDLSALWFPPRAVWSLSRLELTPVWPWRVFFTVLFLYPDDCNVFSTSPVWIRSELRQNHENPPRSGLDWSSPAIFIHTCSFYKLKGKWMLLGFF